MAKETLTLALEGDVALDDFAGALANLNSLLNQLSREVTKDAEIAWLIDELYAGSAVATFRGINGDTTTVENVVNAYEEVGDSLQAGRDIPYSTTVQRHARDLISVLDGRVTEVRFQTATKDIVIVSKPLGEGQIAQLKYAWGSVKGTVETLSMRKKLSFTLWDSLYDKPVGCYFQEGQEDTMRNAWGKRVFVSGRVGRRVETGRPVVIRDVKKIRLFEDVAPGSYRRAKGVFPWSSNSELPEDIIRRLRNA